MASKLLTELLQEIERHQQKLEEQKLEESRNQHFALLLTIIKDAVLYLSRAGIETSRENIADFTAMGLDNVNKTLKWAGSDRKALPELQRLEQQLDQKNAPVSKYDQALAAIFWRANRTKQRLDALQVTLGADRERQGNQYMAQLVGLTRPEFLEQVETHLDDIKAKFPSYKDFWIADSKEVRQFNQKHQHSDTKHQLIRTAVLDIAGGKLASVTATMVAKWNGGAVGLDSRQIDNLLSNEPSLRDLDKYRVRGRNTLHPTDADRAQAFQRNKLA